MKKIIGRLPVNKTYKVLDVDYATIDCGTVCENCGRIISNIATVEDNDGHRYNVGLDCAETMGMYSHSMGFWELKEAKKQLARRARFVKWYKTECKSVTDDDMGLCFYTQEGIKKWSSLWTYRMSKEYFKKTYPFLTLI